MARSDRSCCSLIHGGGDDASPSWVNGAGLTGVGLGAGLGRADEEVSSFMAIVAGWGRVLLGRVTADGETGGWAPRKAASAESKSASFGHEKTFLTIVGMQVRDVSILNCSKKRG